MSLKKTHESGGRAWRLRLGMLVGGICVITVCIVGRYYLLDESANADSLKWPSAKETAPASPRQDNSNVAGGTATPPTPLKIVATVNNEQITRTDLANECLRHYGNDVLESIVNKYLIQEECKRRNISITQSEVNAEIERMATKYSIPVHQWLKMLEEERGITPAQYANDVVWRLLALKKLAGARMEVTQEELSKEFQARYGEAVQARLIVCDDRQTAEEVRAAAVADPDEFGTLAKQKSVDTASASRKGVIEPIRRHMGPIEIEEAVFGMKDQEISPVIHVNNQYVILKREGHLPPVKVSLEQVKMGLIDLIRQGKTHKVAGEVFRDLRDRANVENVLGDPVKSRQMPGVAAIANGHKITVHEVADLCIDRHGKEVLEGTINRRLLEQACASRKITVSDAELDHEIAWAASRNLPLLRDGKPDVQKWLQMVTEEQGVSLDVYRRDSVWPSVALKKLIGDKVQVADQDLQKGYEANFGPRVRCLAIVLENLRHAQKVWQMAANDPTSENFGKLAQQYSADPGSRALRGEVPPIRKHGGQSKLEEEAFSLKPGELSQIVHMSGDTYVILFCEGKTEPIQVDFASVRDEVHEDIFEKKLRIEMAQCFRDLQGKATIDNYLTGTIQSPHNSSHVGTASRVPLRSPNQNTLRR